MAAMHAKRLTRNLNCRLRTHMPRCHVIGMTRTYTRDCANRATSNAAEDFANPHGCGNGQTFRLYRNLLPHI